MKAQTYPVGIAQKRMADGRCPECGEPADAHTKDARFWVPRRCDLLPHGVVERINQYNADQRVNLTEPAPMCGVSDRKVSLESQGASSPSAATLRAPTVDAPATPRAGASTQADARRLAWHEISYRDPRKGERTLRWVKLPDARAQAKKVAAKLGVEVTIWAVYRDATGRETHSAYVEAVR